MNSFDVFLTHIHWTIPVGKANKHKHLGVILDTKLSFVAHIKSAISKTRKDIGLLKYLSKYLPRNTLNELYKLYIRPYLDYGDLIYHSPCKVCEFTHKNILPNLMENVGVQRGGVHRVRNYILSSAGNHKAIEDGVDVQPYFTK